MRCLKLVSYQIFTKVRFKLNMLMRVCLYYYKENDVVHRVCIWAGLLCKPLEKRLKLFTFSLAMFPTIYPFTCPCENEFLI